LVVGAFRTPKPQPRRIWTRQTRQPLPLKRAVFEDRVARLCWFQVLHGRHFPETGSNSPPRGVAHGHFSPTRSVKSIAVKLEHRAPGAEAINLTNKTASHLVSTTSQPSLLLPQALPTVVFPLIHLKYPFRFYQPSSSSRTVFLYLPLPQSSFLRPTSIARNPDQI
jgi:hypothetical protein